MSRRGFTLVETVVVVAVCAALAAILVPALRAASGAARTVACTTNLRQLATAAHAYASANGAMPAAVLYRRDNGLLRTIAWDFEQCGGTVRPGPLWGYSSTPLAVQQCPAFDGPSTFGSDPYTGYNYNTSYVGHEGTLPSIGPGGTVIDGWAAARMGRPLGAIADHARTALFGDGGWRQGANKFMRAPGAAVEGDLPLACGGGQAFRHHGGCSCVAHLDGHVGTCDVPQRGHLTTDMLAQTVLGFPDNGFLSPDDRAYGSD